MTYTCIASIHFNYVFIGFILSFQQYINHKSSQSSHTGPFKSEYFTLFYLFVCTKLKWNSASAILTRRALSAGVKRSARARRAETPACPWRGCARSAAPRAASAPAPSPPTRCSPAPPSRRARDPTGSLTFFFLPSSFEAACQNDREHPKQTPLRVPSLFSSMSEDEGPESGCDTVEGSPASDASASPRANGPYRYLDNNNRPPLAAMVVPLPSPAAQGRSPRGVRTMVVPPMRVQNNNTRGTQEGVPRTGRSVGRAFFCLCWV